MYVCIYIINVHGVYIYIDDVHTSIYIHIHIYIYIYIHIQRGCLKIEHPKKSQCLKLFSLSTWLWAYTVVRHNHMRVALAWYTFKPQRQIVLYIVFDSSRKISRLYLGVCRVWFYHVLSVPYLEHVLRFPRVVCSVSFHCSIFFQISWLSL